MGFKDSYDEHKSSTGTSDFYKFKKGDNKFRIMSEPVKKVSRWGHGICYDGAPYCNPQKMQEEYAAKIEEAKKNGVDPKKVSKPGVSVKWSVWAIDRSNGSFVILDLATNVADSIRKFMDSEEYAFDSFPMPYDINIIADENVGTTKVKYSVLPARKETPVTEEETEEFGKKSPMEDIIEKMKAKAQRMAENGGADPHSGPIEYPDEEINPEDIPF